MPLGTARLNTLSRFVDAGAADRVTITVNGDAQIDTSRSVFGGSSLLTDGTGDYLDVDPVTAGDFVFTGEFTIEGWFNYDNDTGSASAGLFSNKQGAGDSTNFFILFRNFDTKIQLLCTTGVSVAVATGAISADTWNHIALVRDSSNNVAFWLNGTREQFHTGITGNVGLSGSQEAIGIAGFPDGQLPFNQGGNGWMDEVRVSSIARYNTGGNITVPTSPFTNDDDTLFLLHMDGSDGSTDIEDDNA